MAEVLAFVDDIFFQAKILETARQVGVTVEFVSGGEAFTARAAAAPPALLLVDLNSRGGAIETLERLHAAGNPAPVIAFLSHVQVELAERARAAGCQMVLPRSKFTAELASILRGARAAFPELKSGPQPG